MFYYILQIFPGKTILVNFYSDSRMKHTQKQGQKDDVAITELNNGQTQYESLTADPARDVSPQQG